MLTCDEVVRSLKGTFALLDRRAEGLSLFDMSERGFWRSFAVVLLTLPALVVSLALERQRLGLLAPGRTLWEDGGLVGAALAVHAAPFVVLPVVMIAVARGLGLGRAYVPFVVVTNWVLAVGVLILAIPNLLEIVGWAPRGLAMLFTLAFSVIVLHLHWFATRATLGVSNGLAGTIAASCTALPLLAAGAFAA